jgi:hypothetical protein
MATITPKMAAARSFVRSLNILLKFVRLYGFDHSRSAAQFQIAWSELRAAIPAGDQTGLLLGAAGSQIVLDGAPINGAHAERSFAQMLSAAGLASIQFLPKVTEGEFGRFIRAFPVGNSKASALAEQLKSALADSPGIRINEVRFVAEDQSAPEKSLAATLAAKALIGEAGEFGNWLNDPQKLLQLITAAEGSHAGGLGAGTGGVAESGEGTGSYYSGGGWESGDGGRSGSGSGGSGTGTGSGPGTGGSGTGSGGWHKAGTGSGPGPGTGTAPSFSGGMGIGGTGTSGSGTGGWSSGQGSGPGAGATGNLGSGAGPGPRKGRAQGGTNVTPGPGDMGGISAREARDEEVLMVLRLLSRIGKTAGKEGGLGLGPGGAAQHEIEKLPERPRNLLRAALIQLGAQAPAVKSNDPMLVRLAEHLAIRFALGRYERGEVRVNAVRQMLDRMNQEIATLRGIVGSHEEKMASAGLVVESHLDVLDRQFWAAVPESGKKAVLASPDAWCVPPRNLRQYVEELRRKGEEALATQILDNYGAGIKNEDSTARRRVAIGLSEIADLYSISEQLLTLVISQAGAQLMAEREDDLQGLISAAFVRLTQEAGAKRFYAAMLQALDSLEGIEHQRPTFAQDVRPRLGIEKRIPELVDQALKSPSPWDSLIELLKRMPSAVTEHLLTRFNRAQVKTDCERIADLAGPGKLDFTSTLRETLHIAQPSEAAETVGLLSQLDIAAVEQRLGERLRDWPRFSQDRALRLIAAGGAAKRGSLLLAVLDRFEPILQPLAVDEIGMSGETSVHEKLMRLASDEQPQSIEPQLRLKAIEALGRLHADGATELLRDIVEARKHWRYQHHSELRIAALQALGTISPVMAERVRAQCGLTAADLSFDPHDQSPTPTWVRQRRYPRSSLKATLPATATSEKETVPLVARALSLSGGIANGSKHLPPGTLVSLRLGPGLRPIRAQAIMREARGQGLGFEFVAMDLADRARLRSFLRQNAVPVAESREAEEVAEEPVALEK